MKDNHKKILKKYIKVDEPFGSEEAFNISASDFRKLGEDIQRLMYYQGEIYQNEKRRYKEKKYSPVVIGRKGSGKRSYINYMECERRKEYKYEYRIPLTTDKTFSDFERIMKLIDRKAKIDAGLPDRTADMWSIVFWIIFFNYIDRNSHKFTFSEETNANIKKYLEGILGKTYQKPENQKVVVNTDEEKPSEEKQEEETNEASKILEIVEKGIEITYSKPTHSLYEHLEYLYDQGKINCPFPVENVEIREDFDIVLETYCIRRPQEKDFESLPKMVYDYLEDVVGIVVRDNDKEIFREKLDDVKKKRQEHKEQRIIHEEIVRADFLNPNRTDELDDVQKAVKRELQEQGKRVVIVMDASSEPPKRQKHEYAIKGLFRYLRRIKDKSERDRIDIRFCIPAEVVNEYKLYIENPRRDLEDIQLNLEWSIKDLFIMATAKFILYCQIYEQELWNQFDIREVDNLKQFTNFEAAQKILHCILPKKIETDVGSTEDTLSYIGRHTQLLPLQMIIMLNHIWDLDKNEYENHVTNMISPSVIKEGIKEGKESILLDFFESYDKRDVYQNAEFSYNSCIPQLRSVFLQSELEKVFKKLQDEMMETKKKNTIVFTLKDIEDFWAMFFEMGVFGIVTHERRSYVEAKFIYNDPRKEIKSLPKGTNICLHPLFLKKFKGDDSLRFVFPEGSDPNGSDIKVVDPSAFAHRVKKKYAENDNIGKIKNIQFVTDDVEKQEAAEKNEVDIENIVASRNFLKNPTAIVKSKIEAIAEESKPKNIPKSNETQFPQTMSNQERIKRIREQEKKQNNS